MARTLNNKNTKTWKMEFCGCASIACELTSFIFLFSKDIVRYTPSPHLSFRQGNSTDTQGRPAVRDRTNTNQGGLHQDLLTIPTRFHHEFEGDAVVFANEQQVINPDPTNALSSEMPNNRQSGDSGHRSVPDHDYQTSLSPLQSLDRTGDGEMGLHSDIDRSLYLTVFADEPLNTITCLEHTFWLENWRLPSWSRQAAADAVKNGSF